MRIYARFVSGLSCDAFDDVQRPTRYDNNNRDEHESVIVREHNARDVGHLTLDLRTLVKTNLS